MNSLLSKVLFLAGIFLILWLILRFLLPLLLPFLLGAGLALLAEPAVSFLHRRFRLPRGLAAGAGVTAGLCFLFLVLLLTGALLLRELHALAGILPDVGTVAKNGIHALSGWLQDMTRYAPTDLRAPLTRRIGDFFNGGTDFLDRGIRFVLDLAGGLLSHVPDSALGLGTAVISAFMISAKLPTLREKLAGLASKDRLAPLLDAWQRIRGVIGGWLLAQMKLAGITAGILAVGFLLLRIRYGVLWALAVALVDTFPILGTGTVLIPWGIISLLQGDPGRGVGLLGVYATVTLTRSVLEPKLIGHHLGLDPLSTLFALYAGYKVWGLAGMLLAPMLAVAAVQFLRNPTPGGQPE